MQTWKAHPEKVEELHRIHESLMELAGPAAAEQVENAIKPFKYEIEVEEGEWREGLMLACKSLEGEVVKVQEGLKALKAAPGRRTRFWSSRSRGAPAADVPESDVASRAEQAQRLRARLALLTSRLQAIKSRQCGTLKQAQAACCPEAYLAVVCNKLAYITTLFIQVDLLREYWDRMPREVDARLFHNLDLSQRLAFVRENPDMSRHLELQERKDVLEEVVARLESLRRA
jgi:dynamin-like GTPase MGM1, mitochondrial